MLFRYFSRKLEIVYPYNGQNVSEIIWVDEYTAKQYSTMFYT